MIKEKHEKGSDSVKEEPVSANKEPLPGTNSIEVQIKKEEDVSTKKEPSATAVVPITKNGSLVGSTNTGSLQNTPDLKTEAPSEDSVTTAVSETVPLKQEDSIVDNDPLGDPFGLGLGPPTSGSGHPPQTQPESVQPLGSNVINKQSSSMEVQYMQQQSQIFVFSTVLANTGADEVLQGHYSSIIAYHCAQPGTKKYLEKNPLKVTQFNRQHPVQWLNNFAMMKNKGCTRSPNLGPKAAPIENFLGSETLEDMVGLGDADAHWDQKSNHQLEGLEGAVTNGLPDMGPDMDSCSPSLLNVQPKLQGVQVPDENLTPQQRQHREERLASIRKMQQMLFPESQSEGAAGHQEGISPGGAAPLGGSGPGVAPPGQSPVTAQIEWQKLQNQFFDDRTKVKPQQPPQSTANNPSCSGVPLVPVGPVSGTSQPPTPQSSRAGPSLGPRLQGPPPPYHQTQRSASVPIALQSPNPTSPNNPTSNLSLPSPRTSSALNSPADPNRPFGLTRHMSTGQSPTSQDSPSAPRLNHSNPSTPLSSHLSPSVTSSSTEPSSTSAHQSSVDGMFGRTLQSMAQQKQQINTSTTSSCPTLSATGAIKEPNLMPVPSPQQIQYLNTFEGQELIIQKQPNTSLKDGNIISPPVLSTSLDSGFPGNTPDLPHSRVSGPNTPTSMDTRFPLTPGVSTEGCRFQIPSPHTPTATSSCSEKPPQRIPGQTTVAPGMSPQTVPGPTSDPLKNDLFPTPSPHMMDMPRFPGPNASPGSQNKMGSGFGVTVSPQGKPNSLDLPGYCGGRNDNIPLNPNCTSSMVGNPKQSHFDPISSLAQMSQQLTNSAASSLNGQPGQGPVMMSFGSPSMHMMDMGSCHGGMGDMDGGGMMGMNAMQGPPHGFHSGSPMGHMRSHSPKLSGAFPNHMPMQRMMVRAPGPGPSPFNGANVQVKPNAPNTIQYLPAKGQAGGPPAGPRGPPSLDFLTRLASPMNPMMDASKMQHGPGQYFQGGGPGPMQGSPMGHMGHMEGGPGMGQEPPMMGPMGVHMGNGTGSPMMGSGSMGMGSGGPGPAMMPMMRGGPGGMRPMMRVPQMGFGPDGMFPGGPMGPGPGNPQMFVAGPKGSPMGMAPDASQPLPPSMGQGGGFKGAPFVGPTTSDPNYAQQYHNFQQQLYATNTRSQMGGVAQNMGPGPGPPPHMQHLP